MGLLIFTILGLKLTNVKRTSIQLGHLRKENEYIKKKILIILQIDKSNECIKKQKKAWKINKK